VAGMALVVLVAAVAACGGAGSPAADSPEAVVHDALTLTAAKDLEGLKGVACAGQEDLIRDQLSLPGLSSGAELFPGVDTSALLAAVNVDVGNVDVGTASIDGDVATVPVTGSIKVTFDPVAIRPIIKAALEQQGATMTDAQLDALLATLQSYGQDIPLDESIRLVREAGAWKVCQDSITAPGSSQDAPPS
jgi:hypothetical protein